MVVPVAAQDQQPRHLENEEDLFIDLNDDNSQPPADAVAVAVDQTARQIRETELYLYLQEPALSLYVNPYNFAEGHNNPLEWWQAKRDKFPILFSAIALYPSYFCANRKTFFCCWINHS